MPAIEPAPFARRFRALSRRDRLAFLADLWSERGYETTVRDDVVVAVRGDETVRIAVVGLWPRSETDADVLVGTRNWRRIGRHSAGAAGGFLAPDELHELLLYGFERHVADRIAREHLGTPIEIDSPPTPDRSLRGPAAVAFVALALLTVVTLSGIGFPLGSGDDPADTGDGNAATDPVTATGTPTPGSDRESLPEGLSEDGVTDASVLVDTHTERVAGTSRALVIAYSGPANTTLFPDAVRHESEGRFYRGDRFHVDTVEHAVRDDRVVRTEFESYADGARILNRHFDGNGTRYSRMPLSDRSMWTAMEQFAMERYAELGRANDTSVECVRQSGEPLYRVEGVGVPDGFRGNASSYAATAYVTPDGQLVRLSVTYRHAPTDEIVRMTISYGEIGEVGVPEVPEWYDEAVDETN